LFLWSFITIYEIFIDHMADDVKLMINISNITNIDVSVAKSVKQDDQVYER